MLTASGRASQKLVNLRSHWLSVVLSGCLFIFGPVTWAETSTEAIYFKIRAPQLSSALIQLSQQSGRAIVFSDRLIRELPAPQLVGTATIDDALSTLLAGSGLAWKFVDDRVIAIYSTRCEPGDVACVSPEDLVDQYPVYSPSLEQTWVYGSQLTGSRIRRAGYASGAPVDILSSPDIELSGAQTLGELLKFVPAVSGNALSTAISNGGDGTATVTLRGLPASNTLVLIDGRRVANDGLAGESVDLNSIPPAAVERIEILKDGASAIYGSDAIAGVVNVIMKRDFYGFLAEGFYGSTQEGDLDTENFTLQYGTGLPDGSFFFSASRYEQDAILSRNREISRNADTRELGGTDLRSSATPDARITLPNGATVIATDNGYRPASDEDLFNFQAFTTAVVPLERASVYSNASYDFSELLTGYVELSYVETDAESTLAPTPVFTAFEQTPLPVAADNIFNPFGVELNDVRRRLVEFPVRRQRNESEVSRFGFVLEGLVAEWHWDLGYQWSRSEAEETTYAIVNADNLARGIGPAGGCQGQEIDGCVPVNITGTAGTLSPSQVAYISATGEVTGYTKLSSLTMNFSGGLEALPAGQMEMAFGLEARRESTSKRPSQLLREANTIGATNFEPTSGDRDVSEVYAEALIPIWKSATGISDLEMELALRYSDYSDFGSTTNPKIALRWQVNPELLLRASFAEGFRAPSLNELYAGVTESQSFLEDPCTQATNVGSLPGCDLLADDTRNQFLTVTGGNAALVPETAENYSAGLMWTPRFAPGLAFSADYFEIDQSDVVSSSAQFIVNQNARFGLFQDQVQRDEMGNLTLVTASNINIGQRSVSGVDLAMTYHYPRYEWGQVSLVGSATWIDEYLARVDSDAPRLDLSGTFRDAASEGLGGIPEWKAQMALRWRKDRWQGSWQIHYVGPMDELVPGTSTTREIEDWLVHDLQINYTFPLLEGLRVTLGIDNILDKEPPLAASAFNDNIDGRTHELKGRFWYTRLSQRF